MFVAHAAFDNAEAPLAFCKGGKYEGTFSLVVSNEKFVTEAHFFTFFGSVFSNVNGHFAISLS
jgi:hypothetical protein